MLKAEDRRLRRLVAIKELLRKGGDESRRFLREVQLTARLQHPGIVPIYEAGQWRDGTPFYVMKFIDGQTLKDVLRSCTSLDERLALLPKVIAIAETMAYVHSERVIHRDLKPANVLIGPFGETIIVDWGLAKDLDAPPGAPDAGPYRAVTADATVAGAVMGTPAYMPPEQARGEEATPRSDVYALGAILYELLGGVAPYRGGNSADVLRSVVAGPPLPIAARAPGAPRDLAAIVDKAMARDPAQRYADAGELAEDLSRFQTGQLVRAHEYSRAALVVRWVERNRRAVVVAVAALVAMALFGVLSFHRIVRERDRAESRGNELILVHAESQLDQDPTAAVAWAKTYPHDGDEAAVRALLVDAESRGVARHVFRRDVTQVSMDAFSHDGKRVATAEGAATIRISDVDSGRALAHLHHGGDSVAVAWTADDRSLLVTTWLSRGTALFELIDTVSGSVTTLARFSRNMQCLEVRGNNALVAGSDGTVQLWDLGTRTGHVIARHLPKVYAATFSPDGTRVAAGGPDGRISLYQRSDDRLQTIDVGVTVVRLAFTPDGGGLLAGLADGTVARYTVATGKREVLGKHGGAVAAVDVSPDGRWAATASEDRVVELWNLRDGSSRVFAGHGAAVHTLAFSPTAPLVASGGRDRTVRVWNIDTGSVVVLRGHSAAVQSLCFSPDGRRLLSTAEDGSTRVWDVGVVLPLRELAGHQWRVYRLAASQDGRWLASSGKDRTVRIWTAASPVPHAIHELDAVATALAFSPDGARLAIGSENGVIVWDVQSGAERMRARWDKRSETWLLSFSPDGTMLASATADGAVRLWRGTTMETLVSAGPGLPSIAFAPDGHALAAGAGDGDLRVWFLAGGAPRVEHIGGAIVDVAFSPDGHALASATSDGSIRVVARDGSGAHGWRTGHKLSMIAWSHGGRWLAAAGEHVVSSWDVDSGGERGRVHAAGNIYSLEVSRDDRLIAAACGDGALRLIDGASGVVRRMYRTDGSLSDSEMLADGRVDRYGGRGRNRQGLRASHGGRAARREQHS